MGSIIRNQVGFHPNKTLPSSLKSSHNKFFFCVITPPEENPWTDSNSRKIYRMATTLAVPIPFPSLNLKWETENMAVEDKPTACSRFGKTQKFYQQQKEIFDDDRSLWNFGGVGWLCCSCIDTKELKEVEKYHPQPEDPYYSYMLGNGDKKAKTQAYVGKARNPFWKRVWHNNKRFRTKKTRSSAGKWFLEIICGPFLNKESAVTFKKAWSKSRGVPSKRTKALELALKCHVGIYDFRLPCNNTCGKCRLRLTTTL